MSDIFISYRREDKKAAKKLADALQNNGWSVWWDPKLRTGEHFDDAIEKALSDAKCVIVPFQPYSFLAFELTERFNHLTKTERINE